MAGSAIIPDSIGEAGAHISGFSRGGGLGVILLSILEDLRDIADAYNAHDHNGDVATTPTAGGEDAVVGTIFESEA